MEKEWKRKGKKHITKLESKFDGMEWKWNGIGMENFREKNRWDMWWKWKGNEMEMEWIFFFQKKWKKKLMQWNGSGMELKWKISSDKVYIIMYWKWAWNSQK